MKSEENSPYADDEIKIYVDEGDERDEIKKSENLNEDKKQLVGDSDDETDGSARPKDESQENPFLTGPGALQFQQFCSSLLYPGLQSQLARFPFMYGRNDFPIPSPMSMGYPLPPSAHPGLFPLCPPDMSKWAAFPRFPILPNGLPGSPLLPGSPVPPFMPIPGLTSPPLNHLNKIPHPMMDVHEESFRGSMFSHHLNGLNSSDHHFFPNTSYTQQKAPPKKPAIKKPLNAFMIFMKENRPAVIAKYKTKESASINQILGREWHALGREAQQEYYDMAKKEKESHALKYPGWSARDNYAMNSKKKKHKIGHSESASSGSDSPRCNVLKHPPKSCNTLELLISESAPT